jgi:hypothetical protein
VVLAGGRRWWRGRSVCSWVGAVSSADG